MRTYRAMVSIPFHQIMRATCPLFTILIYRLVFSRRYAVITYLSIVPVMLGVGLATFVSNAPAQNTCETQADFVYQSLGRLLLHRPGFHSNSYRCGPRSHKGKQNPKDHVHYSRRILTIKIDGRYQPFDDRAPATTRTGAAPPHGSLGCCAISALFRTHWRVLGIP